MLTSRIRHTVVCFASCFVLDSVSLLSRLVVDAQILGDLLEKRSALLAMRSQKHSSSTYSRDSFCLDSEIFYTNLIYDVWSLCDGYHHTLLSYVCDVLLQCLDAPSFHFNGKEEKTKRIKDMKAFVDTIISLSLHSFDVKKVLLGFEKVENLNQDLSPGTCCVRMSCSSIF